MRKSKAGLFLMELLISLLFFAFAGAICLQLFVGAHNSNQKSRKISHASALLTNYAESFYNSDVLSVTSDIIYYDDELHLCNSDMSVYKVMIYASESNGYLLEHLEISDSDSNEILIDYDLKKYIRRSADASQKE